MPAPSAAAHQASGLADASGKRRAIALLHVTRGITYGVSKGVIPHVELTHCKKGMQGQAVGYLGVGLGFCQRLSTVACTFNTAALASLLRPLQIHAIVLQSAGASRQAVNCFMAQNLLASDCEEPPNGCRCTMLSLIAAGVWRHTRRSAATRPTLALAHPVKSVWHAPA